MIQTGYAPADRSLAVQRARHGLGSSDVHERRVHGERQHALRVPVVLPRREGSALSVRQHPGPLPEVVLRALDDVDPAAEQERLRGGAPVSAGRRARSGRPSASAASGAMPSWRRRYSDFRRRSIGSAALAGQLRRATASTAPRGRSQTASALDGVKLRCAVLRGRCHGRNATPASPVTAIVVGLLEPTATDARRRSACARLAPRARRTRASCRRDRRGRPERSAAPGARRSSAPAVSRRRR